MEQIRYSVVDTLCPVVGLLGGFSEFAGGYECSFGLYCALNFVVS